jgi:hypothetical protein
MSLCFPGFVDGKVKKWGYDFPELIEMLHATIDAEFKDKPVVLCIHDWGSYIGNTLQLPCSK